MKQKYISFTLMLCMTLLICTFFITAFKSYEGADASAGWIKYKENPVLGGKFGTIFDISVLKEPDGYKMYSSWRPKKSIAISESKDGLHWSDPVVILTPDASLGWETDVNRPVVLKKEDGYHMWYTGQTWINGRDGKSVIGYAKSKDGRNWKRVNEKPVMLASADWEKTSVMCPHVIWDSQSGLFKMWYSGGEQYEPDAIGYATSKDGIAWEKLKDNPIFKNDPNNSWEKAKVTACQVIREKDKYLMFYIGFYDENYAQIGLAYSGDGIRDWKRHPKNPIIRPGKGWDSSAVYKPYAIYDGKQWLLWYNGRKKDVEQIGVAIHVGYDLGFDKK